MHRHPVTLTAAHIDVLGHVNNAAYLALFEEARWAVFHSSGVSWSELEALGVSPAILSVKLDFRREVRLGDTVTIETRYHRTTTRRFVVHQRMVDDAGKLRASAELLGAFFDVNARRIVDPPERVLQAVGLTEWASAPPAVQGLGGAFLYANDVDALSAWYTAQFGIEFQQWGPARGVEWPSQDVQSVGLHATTTFAFFQSETPLPPGRTGRVNFRVPDLLAAVARLEAEGIAVEVGQDESFGRFAWLHDPEGNRLELWQPPVADRG